ncbi:MAG: hypothetical protein E7196_11550 [Anaerovibrio lipolyticus]|nr:hypothetical protein [Anaerovibrio lipolyticus]
MQCSSCRNPLHCKAE